MGGSISYGSFTDMNREHPWAYFSVLSSMKAVDYMASIEYVDKNNIYTMGLSWGGFLNLLVLSQDKRIRTGSIIYSSSYIHESEWEKGYIKDLSIDDKKYYIENIEPHNYLTEIDCSV